jgi:hypothetical protein
VRKFLKRYFEVSTRRCLYSLVQQRNDQPSLRVMVLMYGGAVSMAEFMSRQKVSKSGQAAHIGSRDAY